MGRYLAVWSGPCRHSAFHGARTRNLLPQIRQPNTGAVNLFSTLAGAPISRTTSEQYFAKAIDSMAEAFRRSPCSPSLLAPGYRQCILEQKMTANLDTWPAFHSTGEDHPSLPLLPLCFCTTNVAEP